VEIAGGGGVTQVLGESVTQRSRRHTMLAAAAAAAAAADFNDTRYTEVRRRRQVIDDTQPN